MDLTKETVKRLHAEGPAWFRPELENFFGEDFFKPKDFREIKTFNDVCLENGTTEQEFNDRFNNLGLDLDTINYEKAKLVVKAINQGWVPDWNDEDQYKYYPWFKVTSSWVGFSFSFYYLTFTNASVGSRLCFESSEKCKYAAEQFIEIYQQFLL